MKMYPLLSGGNPRSLGRAEEAVQLVLTNPSLLAELFDCLWSDDKIVRMRVGDALEKICCQHPEWFSPYIETLLSRVSKIDQPSVQWHLAQMLGEIELDARQAHRAVNIMLANLESSDDWIVANLTLESLARFVRLGMFSREQFVDLLSIYKTNHHKSVAKRANKLLDEFIV